MNKPTTFSVVIATRNRVDSLSLSLPLMINQTRLPEKIIIVEGSENRSKSIDLTNLIAKSTDVEIINVAAEKVGSSAQRNQGLSLVNSDVVIFPDDDTLVHEGAFEEILKVYDYDRDHQVGGVAGCEDISVPQEVLNKIGQKSEGAYKMKLSDRVKALLAPYRYKIERTMFRDPIVMAGEDLLQKRGPVPGWFSELNAVPTYWMTGFRMSYRRESISREMFNTNLGRYALLEDVDAGLRVLQNQWLVMAKRSRMHHYKARNQRVNGREFGMMHILNRSYIAARNSNMDPRIQAAAKRHAWMKIQQYRSAAAASRFERERVSGAVAAKKLLPELFSAKHEDLDRCYLRLRDECLSELNA